MNKYYQFIRVDSQNELSLLKKEWLSSLTGPQDGMWETFRDNAVTIEIKDADHRIGYGCIGDENQLIQFFITHRYLNQGTKIFQQLKEELKVVKGIVGTNNPIYLSNALHFTKQLDIHTYLFEHFSDPIINEKKGSFKNCTSEDLLRMVDWYHASLGASVEWLHGYLNGLIEKGEVFSFERDGKIIGACEVRRSNSSLYYADIGMIVSPDFRKKGYGTFLLNQAKSIAIKWGRTPICSCEKKNIGSFRSIQNCGFASKYQLLAIDFT